MIRISNKWIIRNTVFSNLNLVSNYNQEGGGGGVLPRKLLPIPAYNSHFPFQGPPSLNSSAHTPPPSLSILRTNKFIGLLRFIMVRSDKLNQCFEWLAWLWVIKRIESFPISLKPDSVNLSNSDYVIHQNSKFETSKLFYIGLQRGFENQSLLQRLNSFVGYYSYLV